MHAIPHALPHRGPGASCARPRWQPYSSISSTSRPSSTVYVNTPPTSVPTPPTIESRPIHDPIRSLKPSATLPHPLKEGFIREAHKARHVTNLVDIAVKSLSEIWNPHDIPAAFSTATRQTAFTPFANNPSHVATTISTPNAISLQPAYSTRYSQLPSPVSPNHPIPVSFPVSISSARPTPLGRSATAVFDDPARNTAAPLKGFVHEVLRRSRTSSGVLKTALCYLEAIRHKIPELVQQEKMGHGARGEADQSDRVVPAEDLDQSSMVGIEPSIAPDFNDPSYFFASDGLDLSASAAHLPSVVAIPLVTPCEPATQCPVSVYPPKKPKSTNLPPLPALPSPLLCPRRSFLAALILASKFMQDKCYSNRAWAKLAGLPPREIGRCERALGEALQWRLWVGKMPPHQSRAPLARSATQSNLASAGMSYMPVTPATCQPPRTDFVVAPRCGSSLRRSATLPANVFSETPGFQQPLGASVSMSRQHTLGPMCEMSIPGPSRLPSFGFPTSTSVPPAHFPPSCSVGSPTSTPALYLSPTSTDSDSSLETMATEEDRLIQAVSHAITLSESTPIWPIDRDMVPPLDFAPKPQFEPFGIITDHSVPEGVGSGRAGWEWSRGW